MTTMRREAEADRRGVMVALVPAEGASKALLEHSGGTEPLEDQHITLAYLGTLGEEVPDDERTRDAVENTVAVMATRYAPLNGEANGWGLFHNVDDVVVALWSIPGINGLRQALVDELRAVGIPVKSNFSFSPHQTMGYYQAADGVQSPGRLPQPVKSDFMALHLHWGGEVITFPLSGVRHEAVKTAAPARGGNPDNPGQFSSEDRGHRKKDKSKSDGKSKSDSGSGKGKGSGEDKAKGAPPKGKSAPPKGKDTGKAPSSSKSTGADQTLHKEVIERKGLEVKVKPDRSGGDYTAISYQAKIESVEGPLSEQDRIEVGDVYGKFLPAGRYPEGDPRNEETFERMMAEKEALTMHYVEAVPIEIPKDADGKPDTRAWVDPANADALREWRENGTGGTTQDLHDRLYSPDGKILAGAGYTPERRKFHQKVLADFQRQYKGYPREGKAVVMAGPPGAGKSTALKNFGQEAFGLEVTSKEQAKAGDKRPAQNYVTINPDDFKDYIEVDPERYEGLNDNELAYMKHEESSHLAEMATEYFMSRGYNVVIDITLGKEESAARKYYEPYEEDYDFEVLLVDGTMENSYNNAGLRWKRPDEETGERTYAGRFIPMDVVQHNAPTDSRFRSKNAEEFQKFTKRSKVKQAYVYDPENPDGGLQSAETAIRTQAARAGRMKVQPREGSVVKMARETTEITEYIEQYRAGQLAEDALIEALVNHDYQGNEACPFKAGTPDWYEWHESNGYQAGTFDEVIFARNSGALSWDVTNKIIDGIQASYA